MSYVAVPVELGEYSYDVLIGEGLIYNAASHARPYVKQAKKLAIIASAPVATLYMQPLMDALVPLGLPITTIEIEDGEGAKCFRVLEDISRQLLQAGLSRNDVVFALGGGVAGDLVGFAAAIYKRGIGFIQIPTSLLAQVDSSVGGKTGINTGEGKNLIGAFHQPSLVLADTSVLNTLAHRQLLSGYAEVVKYALLGDAGFFNWLEANAAKLLAGDVPARIHAIKRSVEMKAGIVSRDEKEQGERMLLNLGHTFGHAFEAYFGYSSQLLHGEAVALGIICAYDYSHKIGLCTGQDVQRVRAHFTAIGLPTDARAFGLNASHVPQLLQLMGSDKKATGNGWTFILCDAIGAAKIVDGVPPSAIEAYLSSILS